MTDVNPDSPKLLKAMNLGFLIVRAKVEMDSVLSPLPFAGWHQSEPCGPLSVKQEVAARGACPDVFEVEGRAPKLSHPLEVVAVNQDTIDGKAHDPP